MKEAYIELTSACNFNCAFCPKQMMTRKIEYMDLFVLEQTLDTLRDHGNTEFVMFSAFGEPLLHPEFESACNLVKDYGFRLIVTSNGSLLDRFFNNPLPCDTLYLSFHSISKKSFSHRRAKNLDFNEYKVRIKQYVSGPHPQTVIYLLGSGSCDFLEHNKGAFDIRLNLDKPKKTLSMINKIATFFEPSFRKIDDTSFYSHNNGYITLRHNLYLHYSQIYNWCNLILPPGYTVNLTSDVDPRTCSYYNDHIVVFANGDVSFCCMDFNASMVQGNILHGTMDEMITRKESIQNLATYSLCRRCKGNVTKVKIRRGVKWQGSQNSFQRT